MRKRGLSPFSHGRLRACARPLAAAVAALAFLVPLAYLVMGALHAPGEPLPKGAGIVPTAPSLGAFERAFLLVPLWRHVANSAVVVAIAVPVSVVIASMAGFAMTLLERRTRRWVVGGTLALLVVPASALWVPRFVLVSRLGLTDSVVPLVLPALMGTTPFAVLLFYWSYRRLPRDLVDAARLEGHGPLGVWLRVAVPLSVPTTTAVAAIVFVVHWGNFVDALLYLYSPERFTAPLGLSQLRVLGAPDQATILAAATVVTAPAVIAFAAVQRWFIQAIGRAGWLGY